MNAIALIGALCNLSQQFICETELETLLYSARALIILPMKNTHVEVFEFSATRFHEQIEQRKSVEVFNGVEDKMFMHFIFIA